MKNNMNLIQQIKTRALNSETRIDMHIGVTELPPVLSIKDIEKFEQEIGYPLPELLKQLFLQIGNGGFGPGYGLFPLISDKEENMLNFSQDFVDCQFDFWKTSHIPLVHWGCGIYTFMDLDQPEAQLQVFDGNNYDEEDPQFNGVFNIPHNLESFLQAWVDDVDLWKQMFAQ